MVRTIKKEHITIDVASAPISLIRFQEYTFDEKYTRRHIFMNYCIFKERMLYFCYRRSRNPCDRNCCRKGLWYYLKDNYETIRI